MYELIAITAVFTAFHFAVKWLEARQAAAIQGEPQLGLVEYLGTVPAFALVAVLGTVGMFMVANSMGWLNPGMAAATGYAGSDIAKRVVKQFENVAELNAR